MVYTYDDLDLDQLTALKRATDEIKDIYVWALGQSHIMNPLAYAIYEVWKKADKGAKE